MAHLKAELQRKLHRSRPADLVQGIEATGSAAGAERSAEHLGLAEQRRDHIIDPTAEVRAVEDVEEVGRDATTQRFRMDSQRGSFDDRFSSRRRVPASR